MAICSDRAWNNFVLLSDPSSFELGTSRRAAAIANIFLGAANNGGLNSFLTCSSDLDGNEVVDSLLAIGAALAGHQLDMVLRGLAVPLPISSQAERWARLDAHWHEDLDQYDCLTKEADEELVSALSKHVAANEEFYCSLG